MFSRLFFFTFFLVTVSSSPKPNNSALNLKDLTQEVQLLAKTLHNVCVNKTNINEKLIEKAKTGIFENEDQLKQYITCLWKESTLLDGSKINIDAIKEFVPPEYKEIIPKLLTTCFNKFPGEKTIEDRIMKMEKCVFATNPQHFVLF